MHDDDTTERTLFRAGGSHGVIALLASPSARGGVWCDVDEARRALAAQPSAEIVVVLADEGRVNAVLDRCPTADEAVVGIVDAVAVTDAVKRVRHGLVVDTVDRGPLRRLRAPAVFRRAVVERAVDAVATGAGLVDLLDRAMSLAALDPETGARRPVRGPGASGIALGARDLVVFDNDGVLVDSEPISLAVLGELLAERGWPMSIDDVARRFKGGSLDRAMTMAREHGAAIEPDFAGAYHAALFGRYEHELRAVEGVVDVLDELDRRAVPYCVASSGSRARVELSLTMTGLRDRFGDRVVSADDVARGKPDPALFLRSASVQGADPARCLVVEDSALGIEAARRAGMRAVGIATLTPPDELADASEGIVGSMAELLAALG